MNNQQTTILPFHGARISLCCNVGLAAIATTLAGCTQVQPKADYERTRQLVVEATGTGTVYDPDAPLLTDEELDAILRDGLTLEEAVRIALLNNRRLQAEFMSIGVAKADWVQAGLLSNPTLGFSTQFPEGGGRSNLQASIAQNIVDLWQIPRRKQIAQADLDATVLRIADTAAKLVAQTKTAYFDAVAAGESLRLAEENLKLTTKSHDAIKAQRQAGAASALDENLARGQVLSAELGVRNARLAAANAKRRLAGQMSIARAIDNLAIIDSLVGEVGPLEPEKLVEIARQKRLDLRALECAAQSRLADLGLQRLSVFSDVSVGVMFERSEQRALPGRKIGADFVRSSVANGALTVPEIQSRSERQAAQRQEIDTILGPSLSMSVPIFDQNQARIAKAQYLYWQELKTYEAEYLQAVQEIRTAADQAQTALGNTRYYQQEIVPQAERNLEFSRVSYSSGQTGILTLLEAQRLLLESRRGYIAARLELATAISELEQKVGAPMGKSPETISPTSKPAESTPAATKVEK